MRVLRVAHHAPVSAWRERERQLIAAGVDVDLISSRQWNEGGVDVRLDPGADTFVVGASTLGRHPNVFVYDPRPIWRALRSGRFDLLDLHEEPCSLATAEVLMLRRLAGVRTPYVLYSAQNLEKRYPVPFRWFERRALRGAAGAYVCNREAGEILRRKGLAGPARLIPLGVDLTELRPAHRAAPTGDPLRVGYFGRLESHKGVSTLVEAAADRPGWQVQVTGDGPDRARLQEQVAALGLADRVDFLGYVDPHSLGERYRAVDVVVVPSVPVPGWIEQFCRVAVEAMACGVPVVASRSGAIPDVVGDAGLLFEPGDAGGLARAVDELAEPGRWQDLRDRGLARAGAFTWREVAREQLSFYQECVGVRTVAQRGRDPQVIVVAYGSPALLEDCLSSLGGELPVTVVDNSSLADTRAVAERQGARYVDAGANLGFGAGVNLGLRTVAEHGHGDDDVLLLNPDVLVDADAIRSMHQQLVAAPRTACIGATQIDPGTGLSARVFWPFPTPLGAWVEAVGAGRLRRRDDFVIGSLLLLRADALASLGGLDERFFLYSEETDWQKRARDRGWDIAIAQVASSHIGAGTSGDPGRRETHFHAGLERFVRKHHGSAGWVVFRAGMVVGAGLRAAVLPGDRGSAARRRLHLYLAGPVRVEGSVG